MKEDKKIDGNIEISRKSLNSVPILNFIGVESNPCLFLNSKQWWVDLLVTLVS